MECIRGTTPIWEMPMYGSSVQIFLAAPRNARGDSTRAGLSASNGGGGGKERDYETFLGAFLDDQEIGCSPQMPAQSQDSGPQQVLVLADKT